MSGLPGPIARLLGRSPVSAQRPAQDSTDFRWMFPPSTMVDPAPWDQFWDDQLTHRVAGFVHMFCRDGKLVDTMRANGLKRVLCVGNGISLEPYALARAGFEVTALDLSPYATQLARTANVPEELLADMLEGRSAAPGGSVEFVVGDLCNAACCPGPYDVILERKTLQLYPPESLPTAMRAVADRLSSPGIFFSHSHDGGWRPSGGPPRNVTDAWLDAEGWPAWNGEGPLAGRVAWTLTSTG